MSKNSKIHEKILNFGNQQGKRKLRFPDKLQFATELKIFPRNGLPLRRNPCLSRLNLTALSGEN